MFHIQQMSKCKNVLLISLLYGLFTFRILYVIFKTSISVALILSFLVGIIIWLFSKEGMTLEGLNKGKKMKSPRKNSKNNNQKIVLNRHNNNNNNNRNIMLNRRNNSRPPRVPITAPKKIPLPVNEYSDNEKHIYKILNNSINPSLTKFNNDFKRLDDLANYETEDEFNEFLRDKIQPQLKNIKSLYDIVKNSLMKRSSDTRYQKNVQGGKMLFYNKDTWNIQQRQSQNIQSKINTFNSQIKGFIQRIKQQKQEESIRTINVKPTPPLPPQDEYTYIPPSSSYLSNYSNNKYINQFI